MAIQFNKMAKRITGKTALEVVVFIVIRNSASCCDVYVLNKVYVTKVALVVLFLTSTGRESYLGYYSFLLANLEITTIFLQTRKIFK